MLVRPFMSEYDDREELQILKLMKPITLYHLDDRAAKALICEPLQGRIAFEEGRARDCLYQLTAGASVSDSIHAQDARGQSQTGQPSGDYSG